MTRPTSKGIRPEHRVVLIKIPRSAPNGDDPAALLEATSKWWVVAEARRDGGAASPEYALAVLRGRVVVAYEIDRWQQAPSGGRWGFTGRVSTALSELYRGMDVTAYFPPGAANPLRYVNCGVPRPDARPRPREPQPPTPGGDLAAKVARLMSEPLTHLMLGHRELCHSNLLAWFFETMPAYADAVFGVLTHAASSSGTSRKVHREKNNLDLMFCWPDRAPLIIENKVFSLPDEDQLEKYALAAAAQQDPALWLLSLTNPNWPDDRRVLGGREWRWLSFQDLAARLRQAVPAGDQSYEAQTMARYAGVVELLSEIVAEVAVAEDDDPVAFPADVGTALGERMGSVLAKLRALSVAARIRAALEEAPCRITEIETGFTNGLPVLSWFGPVGAGPGALAGWQLQGSQFRLALVTPHLEGTDPETREKRFALAAANEGLFDFKVVDSILRTGSARVMPTPGPRNPLGFNRYDPDFTYRYKHVPNLTVGELESAAVAVARRIEAGAGV